MWVTSSGFVRLSVCTRSALHASHCNRSNKPESGSLTGAVTWGVAHKAPLKCVCVTQSVWSITVNHCMKLKLKFYIFFWARWLFFVVEAVTARHAPSPPAGAEARHWLIFFINNRCILRLDQTTWIWARFWIYCVAADKLRAWLWTLRTTNTVIVWHNQHVLLKECLLVPPHFFFYWKIN